MKSLRVAPMHMKSAHTQLRTELLNEAKDFGFTNVEDYLDYMDETLLQFNGSSLQDIPNEVPTTNRST